MCIDRITLICLQDKHILTARTRGKDAWYLPGGKREHGESDLAALMREVREELAVDIVADSARLYGVFEGQAHGKAEGVRVKLTCYLAELSGQPVPSSEVEELRWMTYADLAYAPPADKQIYGRLYREELLA